MTPTSPKKPDEDAGAEAEITTALPAEGAASQDEETSPKDESDGTEHEKDEVKPEPPADPPTTIIKNAKQHS